MSGQPQESNPDQESGRRFRDHRGDPEAYELLAWEAGIAG